jgi:hypothetical protein
VSGWPPQTAPYGRHRAASISNDRQHRYLIFAITCPFALLNRAGRRRVLDAYADDPQPGVIGLVMEHLAVSLNPRQGLMGGKRLASLLADDSGQQHTPAAFQQALDQMPWRLYEVRRATLPKRGDPRKSGGRGRWLESKAAGTRQQMIAELHKVAAVEGLAVTAEDGIPRAWRRRRAEFLPAADWFYVAAPEGAHDKEGRGFAAAWPVALQGPAQGELFGELPPARYASATRQPTRPFSYVITFRSVTTPTKTKAECTSEIGSPDEQHDSQHKPVQVPRLRPARRRGYRPGKAPRILRRPRAHQGHRLARTPAPHQPIRKHPRGRHRQPPHHGPRHRRRATAFLTWRS